MEGSNLRYLSRIERETLRASGVHQYYDGLKSISKLRGVGPTRLEVIPTFYPHNNIGHIGCQQGSYLCLVEKERFELSTAYFIREYHPNNFCAGACSRPLFQLNTISMVKDVLN